MITNVGLFPCLVKIAQLQNEPLDQLALKEVSDITDAQTGSKEYLAALFKGLYLNSPKWLPAPDASNTPALAHVNELGWIVVRGKNAIGAWIIQRWCEQSNNWVEEARDALSTTCIAVVKLTKPFTFSDSKVATLISQEILSSKKLLLNVFLASLVINAVGLSVSLYTMLVYDRVIPTGASQTLFVLSLGVSIAVIYEFVTNNVR